MARKLVISEEFFNSLNNEKNKEVLKNNGYNTPQSFINGIILKLKDEFSFIELNENDYRFPTLNEINKISQYSAFIDLDGDNYLYNDIFVFFTPILSKSGNVIVEQSLMPTICSQMENDISFLLNPKIKKIVILTSQINSNNSVSVNRKAPVGYNAMQRDINSLNTLNFDVVSMFKINNISTDTKFNSLVEYIDICEFLQRKNLANSQYPLLQIKGNVLYGDCESSQWQGEFPKSFCFKFLTSILVGGNDYKYNVSKIQKVIGNKKDRQFENLKKFVDYANQNIVKQLHYVTPNDDDIVESDEDVKNIYDIHRMPEKAFDSSNGRKRYKTQKKIKDKVLEDAKYLCNCHDLKHFYFESVELHNFVEGHHIVPMNRQDEYYFGKNINLDIHQNIAALCPNCHSQIHFGSRQARLKMLSELYVRNKAQLLTFDPTLTLSALASYYNIGLEKKEEADWIKRATKIVDDKSKKLI